jgi:hypothetical protein
MTGYWWGVKRFLSLFWVVYICLKDKCISACEPQDFVTSFCELSAISGQLSA